MDPAKGPDLSYLHPPSLWLPVPVSPSLLWGRDRDRHEKEAKGIEGGEDEGKKRGLARVFRILYVFCLLQSVLHIMPLCLVPTLEDTVKKETPGRVGADSLVRNR